MALPMLKSADASIAKDSLTTKARVDAMEAVRRRQAGAGHTRVHLNTTVVPFKSEGKWPSAAGNHARDIIPAVPHMQWRSKWLWLSL